MAPSCAYRKALPLDSCRNEIEKNIGLMYDPHIVIAALEHLEELTRVYREDNEKAYIFSASIQEQECRPARRRRCLSGGFC